jgi:hypothetical protein
VGPVETKMVEYIKRRLGEGALSVSETEIMEAVIPADQPEFRLLPAYRYGLERLLRRRVINGVCDADGKSHFFIGNVASKELLQSLSKPTDSK